MNDVLREFLIETCQQQQTTASLLMMEQLPNSGISLKIIAIQS
jgi:hypothetical protein